MRWVEWLTRECELLGLSVTPSVANFILVRFPGGERSAPRAAEYLRAHGIIPRPVDANGQDYSLRITIGLDADNERLITVLRSFMSRGS